MTLTQTQLRELLDRHGIRPSRALGQNFVVDPNTVRRVARLAGVGPSDQVIEIGAGAGCLTLALAETGAAVTTVEVDRHLIPLLREVLSGSGVRLVEADAMTLDWDEVLATGPKGSGPSGDGGWVLVGNLPYNVATPLVLDLLDEVPAIGRMLVMVQKEVGERLASCPGGPSYGIPSVKVAYWATAEVVGKVGPSVFLPQPKVDSVLVSIVRRSQPATDAPFATLFGLVRRGFGQRRKMLRGSLAGVVTPQQFAAAGIRPEARPEELGIDEWGRLALAVSGPDIGP